MTSSYRGCEDCGTGTVMEISSSPLHILTETSSSQAVVSNTISSGTKKRKTADTDATETSSSQAVVSNTISSVQIV